MPTEPVPVTVDDVFDILARLNCPAVYAGPDDLPGLQDLPQLVGALTAAVDRLTVTQRIPLNTTHRRQWAAGYLQMAGATSTCGMRLTFDLLSVRLQMFESLFEGLGTPGSPIAQLIRACLGAAACYSVVGSAAQQVRSGDLDGDRDEVRALARTQLDTAHTLLRDALDLEAQLRRDSGA